MERKVGWLEKQTTYSSAIFVDTSNNNNFGDGFEERE